MLYLFVVHAGGVPLKGYTMLFLKTLLAVGLGSVAMSQWTAVPFATNSGRLELAASSKVLMGFS